MTRDDLSRSRRRRRASGGVDRLPSGRWRARFYGPDARRVAALLGAAVHAALPATVLSPPIAATGQADNENARPAAARAPTSIPIAAPLGMQS